MGDRSNQEYARRGLRVLLVATAVVVYMVLDPGWPFLVSVVIFTVVVPALVWLAVGAIYPKEVLGLAVPIDRGSDNGFAIHLDAEPTGGIHGLAEIFLRINGASLQSIESAGLATGSPIFVHVEEGEARRILAEMVEFGIRGHLEREAVS